MTRTIVVHRRGYWRGPYTYRRRGRLIKVKRHYVKPTTYRLRDVGARGRGPRRIPIKAEGALRRFGYSINKSRRARRRALRKAIEAYGALKVWRRLHAQVQLREEAGIPGPKPRRGVKEAWRIFREDRDWVAQFLSKEERLEMTAPARMTGCNPP
jgi:hypothetical protein